MTREEQKNIIADAIMAIKSDMLLDIVLRLIYGVLKNDEEQAAKIIKKAIRGQK